MIIIPPAQLDFAVQHEYSIRYVSTDESRRSYGTLGDVSVSTVRVRGTQYDFLKSPRGEYDWSDGYTFRVPQVHLTLKGKGATFSQARRDWELQFHALFQRLYSTPSFEMSPEEVNEWKRIRTQIDVNAYSDSLPLTAREIGQVRFGHASHPTEIRWVDGRRDRIQLDRVHRVIAGARTGQYVEAWVERDPATKQISQIILAERIGSLFPLTDEQAAKRWARLPKAKVPSTDWDWPNRD
jgi:hypothetical protein